MVAASGKDREGAKAVLLIVYLATPICFVFAEAGFAGRLVDWAARVLKTTLVLK